MHFRSATEQKFRVCSRFGHVHLLNVLLCTKASTMSAESFPTTNVLFDAAQLNLLRLTTTVAATYVGHHKVAISELSFLIKSISKAFVGTGFFKSSAAQRQPAVPINQSVTRHFLVCLEDGKKLKMLKRQVGKNDA